MEIVSNIVKVPVGARIFFSSKIRYKRVVAIQGNKCKGKQFYINV